MDAKSRRVPKEDDASGGSTEHHAKLVAPAASSGKEVARLEHERLGDLEQQLSKMLAERNRHIAQLTDELTLKSALLVQAQASAVEEKNHAGLELRELQAKLDKANEMSQPACEHETELVEVHAKLEARESELTAVRLQLMDAEDRWARSKAEADTLRAQTAAGPVNADVDRVMHRLMERMRAMEAEMDSRRWSEKSMEEMECRNEG